MSLPYFIDFFPRIFCLLYPQAYNTIAIILHTVICYAGLVCELWGFWKSCVKTDHEMRMLVSR